MRLRLVLAAALGLAVVAAAAAAPVNATDRANAARACSSLRSSLGTTTFSHQYASFGACTSQWVKKAHAARMAALTSCRSKGLKGTQLATCVKTQTRSTLASTVSVTKNASRACAADLRTIGLAAFEQKYLAAGVNHNLRNAFGKCVSSHVKSAQSTGGTSTGGKFTGKHFNVVFSPLNQSGVTGTGSLLLNRSNLTVKLDIAGLEAGQSHEISIRGLSSGTASCPTGAADANNDGLVSAAEGQASFGTELLALTPSTLGHPQAVSSSLLPLQSRAIVVFGMTVKGTYDATLPVACGVITAP